MTQGGGRRSQPQFARNLEISQPLILNVQDAFEYLGTAYHTERVLQEV